MTILRIRKGYDDDSNDDGATTDLEKPLLFVPFRSRAAGPDVRATALLIDGWHRLYKAVVSDVQELPAYALTEAEAASILLWALPPGSGIDWGQRVSEERRREDADAKLGK